MISLKYIVFLAAAIGMVHGIATLRSWYWVYPWFDMPMHFLGGACAALFLLWLRPAISFTHPLFSRVPQYVPVLFMILAAAAFVGVLWEIGEFAYVALFVKQKTLWLAQGRSDTVSDLSFDLLGALLVAVASEWERK